MQQRTCLWRLLAASLAVSLAIGYSVNEYYFSHSWNETVDHDGIERKSVLKRVTLGAELNPGFRKAEIVEAEAAPAGERLGGGERRAGGVLSLNGDDEAGDAPGGMGFGAGLGAGDDVTRHGNLRGSSNIKKALLSGVIDQGLDAVATAALVSPEGQKTRHVWSQAAASSGVIVGDGLNGAGPTNMETDGEHEDVDIDVYEDGLQDSGVEEEPVVEAYVPPLPPWHSWIDGGGSGMNIASGRQWTDEELLEAARKQAFRAVPLLAILLLDDGITDLRGLFMAETHNAARTQALLSTASLSRVMWMFYFLASIGDERGTEAWALMTAIVDAIEATGLTSMSRTRILQGVLTTVISEHARGTLAPAGHISPAQAETLVSAVCSLLQLAQCSYAAENANMLSSATFHDLDVFWGQMNFHASGRQVAKGFKPMYEQEFQQTGACMVIIASPTSRQVQDVDGRSVPTPVLMVCAVEATFDEMRMVSSWARVAVSDVHKCYEAMRIMHEGLDGTPTGVFEEFALALGRQANYIASAFGLHKPVPPPPTPLPPTPQPPTATPYPSFSPTPAPTWAAYGTNWGTRQQITVVPCDSRDFEEVQDARVGFFKLVKLICPEDANPDHVRQAIHRLFRSGASFGDLRLAALLFEACGAGRWVPGPTYETSDGAPDLRA